MSVIPAISPCIGECKLDENQNCRGCFRSLEQISQWRSMTIKQQQAITQQLMVKIKARDKS